MKHSSLIISTEPLAQAPGDGTDGDGPLELDSELRQLQVGVADHGLRLDLALAAMVPELSRSYLQQLIASGAVQLNGVTGLKASQRVKAGDACAIELRPTPQSQAFKPEPMPLEIVFRDDHLLVINKPAGLVVHPAPGNWSGTLLNGLLALDGCAATLPRAGIVHRLDKDTSGLMVVARTRAVMDALVLLIAERAVARQYLAVTHRPWTGANRRDVDFPIGRDPRNRLRMAVVDLDRSAGKTAKTTLEVVDTCATGSLVRCTLHTGRTHQIRVHMAAIGCPLVSDEVYGGLVGSALHRQALHAYRLAFQHPLTGAAMVLNAPLPPDLQNLLVSMGLSYNP